MQHYLHAHTIPLLNRNSTTISPERVQRHDELRPFWNSRGTVWDLGGVRLKDGVHFGPAQALSGLSVHLSSRIAAILGQLGYCPGSRGITAHGLRPF